MADPRPPDAPLSLHDAIHTLRAVRRLRPDPVPEAELRYLVEAATRAPSGENRQTWRFVVVTDATTRARLGEVYRGLGERYLRDGALASGRLDPDTERVYRHAMTLVETLGRAPALVVPCMEGPPPRDPAGAATWWGSIFPAVQNLLLAARARGLGTTLTTLHRADEAAVKALLGIPAEVEAVALIPVGYPAGRGFGPPRRRPADEVTFWDRWGARRQP